MKRIITFEYFEKKEEKKRIETAMAIRNFSNLSLDQKVSVIIVFGIIMKAINKLSQKQSKVKK